MPIIPIYSGQLARQDPNEPDPNSPWNGLDEKIMRGLMVGTQLKKAGIEARAAEQDIQAKQQAMGMAAERQGWARQEQGWKAEDRDVAETERIKRAEAAMNLYEMQNAPLQTGQPTPPLTGSVGPMGGILSPTSQTGTEALANELDGLRQRGIEYAKTLPPGAQETYLKGLDQVIMNRGLRGNVEGAAAEFQNFLTDLQSADKSDKYDFQLKGFQQRLDRLPSLPPEQQFAESAALRKEMDAQRTIIEAEELRLSKIPNALATAASVIDNLKASGNWDNNPNRADIDAAYGSLMFRTSTVDPDKVLSDIGQLSRGYRKWQDADLKGNPREFWVSDKQYAEMMADKIQREAVERQNELNRSLRRQEIVGRFVTSAMNVAGRTQAAQAKAISDAASAEKGQAPKPAQLTPKQMVELRAALEADESTYPQYDGQTFSELPKEVKETILQETASSMLSRVNRANQGSFDQVYGQGQMRRTPLQIQEGQEPDARAGERQALMDRFNSLSDEQKRFVMEAQQRLGASKQAQSGAK